MSAADPKVFGDDRDRGREPVQRQDVHASYLPAASPRAGSRPETKPIARYYIGFVGFTRRSGTSRTWTSTPRRAQASRRRSASVLDDLTVGQVLDDSRTRSFFIAPPGDVNQEDVTNDAAWACGSEMRCFRFALHGQPGRRPLLPDWRRGGSGSPATNLQRTKSVCP